MKSKAVAIGYLMRVSAGNVNASHSEGNVIVTKKVTLPDGNTLPYISGQALRRMLRDRLEDLGWPLSEPFSQVSGQEVTPPVRPWEFIDEDLFGYLDPSGGRRRTSPVRVSAAIGLFPFQGDRDLGTRSFEKFGQTMETGGNMFETEIYHNLFRGSLLIELDRVGVFQDLEIGDQELPEDLSKEEVQMGKQSRWSVSLQARDRVQRLRSLLDALNILWGGGRTARMLADLSPKFFAYARLSVKHPVFLEALEARFADGAYHLVLTPLTNALKRFKGQIEAAIFGIEPAFLGNEKEVRDTLAEYGAVTTVSEAIQKAKEDLEAAWSS
ncbi:MAG: type I-B CRISPR-associated protein Cas7/Cst2/DevR [Deltaproteobacteria bacterium]|nr:MAG: type I-B CRISPR-associated protein Cas7/Cst2/DevR [Deltaproteobacteria bacterium]